MSKRSRVGSRELKGLQATVETSPRRAPPVQAEPLTEPQTPLDALEYIVDPKAAETKLAQLDHAPCVPASWKLTWIIWDANPAKGDARWKKVRGRHHTPARVRPEPPPRAAGEESERPLQWLGDPAKDGGQA